MLNWQSQLGDTPSPPASLFLQAQAHSKKEAERGAAEKAVWELRQRQGIVWPDGAFVSTAANKPGEPLPLPLAAMAAGKAVKLTEEFIRTLSGEQVAMIQQLA